jgi:hypothetical protein
VEKPLGQPRRRWLDNIKMDLRETGWDGLDSCGSGYGPVEGSFNTIMNFGFHKMLGYSQEGFNSMSECGPNLRLWGSLGQSNCGGLYQ